MNRVFMLTLTALAVFLPSATAPAITHTWNGGNGFGPDSMSIPLNWSGGTPVNASANLTLIFPNGPSSNQPNQNIANPLSVQSLQFAPNNFYIMTGNAYQMNNLGAAPTIDIGANSAINFGTPLDFNTATTVSVGENAQLQVSQLTGGNLTINSTATNNQATINFNNAIANSLGGTNTVSGYGLFQMVSPANVATFGGNVVVSGLSSFQQAQLRANNANQFATGTNMSVVNFGSLQAYAPQTLNNVEVSSGGSVFIHPSAPTLTIQGVITNNGGVGQLGTFGGSVDFDGQFKTVNTTVAGGTLAINSPIVNGRINKIGPGRLELNNAGNSFIGQNVVNAGVLYGNPDSIGTNVLNNATVELGFGTLTSNIISGPGNVVVNSITFGAAQSYLGGTSVISVAAGDSNTLLGDFSSSTSGEMGFTQNFNGTYSGNMSGNVRLAKYGTGVLSLGGNSTTTGGAMLFDGGLNFLTDTALGTGAIQSAGFNVTLEATGNRTLPNQLLYGSPVSFVGSGNLSLTDTSNKTQGFAVVHNSTGTTEIDGKYLVSPSGTITVNSGNLILGDPSVVGGFSSAGSIVLNGGVLTVRSLNFTTLADVTLANGTLDAPNGYAIPLGAALQGTGNVTGRVATANGSTIIATGAMGLGDPSHPAGVNLDGELYTNQFIVSMSDSNQAVLGSLTDIGTATQNGMLSAGNGFVLNFGRNIVGRGQIQSNNLLADAAIINGDVNGDSFTNYLEFTGYVKGVGTFNNVAFSGTFSPGLSPTLMTVGNTILTPSNVLDMELGGLARGGQYDAFDITNGRLMQLDGELQVSLINAFNPGLGDQFLLFQGLGSGAFGGTFDTFDFPALDPGLAWDTSLLYSSGILQVVNAVPEPVSLLPLAFLSAAFWRRRRA